MKKFIITMAVVIVSITAVAAVMFIKTDINISNMEVAEMAKSKLINTNEKIAESVVGGYKKIEDTVVGGYKKIEDTVVGAYKKIENKFVDEFLTHDGESVEDAKMRLTVEQIARKK